MLCTEYTILSMLIAFLVFAEGADRCTVTASEERIVAGRYVTYVLQCASLGDKAKFYFNMGDRFYFYSTDPIYTASASDAVRARTRIELTLQLPSERYLYYYKHWFSSPGEYSLTVQVYNGEYPTAKYITIVLVDPYPDICFPTVSIINGTLAKTDISKKCQISMQNYFLNKIVFTFINILIIIN